MNAAQFWSLGRLLVVLTIALQLLLTFETITFALFTFQSLTFQLLQFALFAFIFLTFVMLTFALFALLLLTFLEFAFPLFALLFAVRLGVRYETECLKVNNFLRLLRVVSGN